MSQEAVEKLLGRMITDGQFRQLAAQSLEISCLHEGYFLTKEELKLLSGLNVAEFSRIENQLSPCLRRA